MTAALRDIPDAICNQIRTHLTGLPYGELQVVARRWFNATPPCVDIYPADPSQEATGMGITSREVIWTLRARVAINDEDTGQDLLLDLLDRQGGASMSAAVAADRTFGGAVDDSLLEQPTGHRIYEDVPGNSLLGCEWRLRCEL